MVVGGARAEIWRKSQKPGVTRELSIGEFFH